MHLVPANSAQCLPLDNAGSEMHGCSEMHAQFTTILSGFSAVLHFASCFSGPGGIASRFPRANVGLNPNLRSYFNPWDLIFLFSVSAQLGHSDRGGTCLKPIHFSDGKWNCSMSWHWEGICSEWVWDKLLNHKVEANHQKNVFNRECAGWWHEDLTWVMLGSCRQSWPVPRACLCQTCGTASGRCIMQLPRVCCPRHLRRANSAGPRRCLSSQHDRDRSRPGWQQVQRRGPQGSGTRPWLRGCGRVGLSRETESDI